MERSKKIILEAEKGITFQVSEQTNGIVIKAVNSSKLNDYSSNYVNPIILKGYKHICGEWYNGFVIERCTDGSQFVWIPVGSLKSNGTLDGKYFVEKFGRRNYMHDKFAKSGFSERVDSEQIKSIKQYGGFYISRFNISKSPEEKPQSIKGAMPWTEINFYDAHMVASTFEDNETVTSHMPFGAEYDSVLEWFIQSKARTSSEIVFDSTNWGNHFNTTNSSGSLIETGSIEKYCTNNIYDFAGNISEWTQETFYAQDDGMDLNRVPRGGEYDQRGYEYPVATRYNCCSPEDEFPNTGFRIVLCIK